MAEMGAYCKAYPAARLREFPGWSAAPVRDEGIADDDVLYLHDDFTVSRGIFKDERVVYADASDAWRGFCTTALRFCIPDYCRTSSSGRRP